MTMDTQNQNNQQISSNVPEPASSVPVPEPQLSDSTVAQPVSPTVEPVSSSEPVSAEPAVFSTPAVESTVQVEPVAPQPAVEPQAVIEPVVPGMESTGAPVAQDSEANLGLSDESGANLPPAPAPATSPENAVPTTPTDPTTPQAPVAGV